MTDPDSARRQLHDGSLKPYELDELVGHEAATTIRREHYEETLDVSLDAIGEYSLSAEQAESNIENMIGAVQIPLGIAGPLTVDGAHAAGSYHLPLATTEGALVASVNRGCRLLEAAGGATARITDAKMTRAPVFAVPGVEAAIEVIDWLGEHEAEVIEAAEATTSHGEVLSIDPYVVGDNLFLRFAFDTKDAMGMNMVTVATRAACQMIEAETDADLVALSGNLCTDKKPAAINAVEGRGYSVTAEATLSDAVLEDVLGVPATALAEVNTRKNLIGSAKAGSLGFNAQVANVVASMFLATGQDEAQVVEGSNAITTVDTRDDGVYVSVTLASLELGTVGGGTKLATQHEALELLGVAGGGDPPGSNAKALAEVVATATLAGELSLLGALGSRHLAAAHERLGR